MVGFFQAHTRKCGALGKFAEIGFLEPGQILKLPSNRRIDLDLHMVSWQFPLGMIKSQATLE